MGLPGAPTHARTITKQSEKTLTSLRAPIVAGLAMCVAVEWLKCNFQTTAPAVNTSVVACNAAVYSQPIQTKALTQWPSLRADKNRFTIKITITP